VYFRARSIFVGFDFRISLPAINLQPSLIFHSSHKVATRAQEEAYASALIN